MIKTVEVAVLHTGWIRYELANALLNFICEERHRVIVGFSNAKPQMHNHNLAVKRFLEGDADYLLIMGDDARPQYNLLDLVEKDLDVVGFPHPVGKWTTSPDDPIVWNLVTMEGSATTLDLADGLIEVASIGSGAILIARRVLEHPAMRAPFMDEWNRDGIRSCGGDMAFCFRAREAGFKVWAALSHLCGQIKEVDLALIYELLTKVKVANG